MLHTRLELRRLRRLPGEHEHVRLPVAPSARTPPDPLVVQRSERQIDARVGGALRYDMIAATAEMIAAMKQMGRPASHATRSRFTEVKPHERLVLTNVIDFLPGVATYESNIAVDLSATGDRVRMVVTLDGMHTDELTKMQEEGFTSQLTKLDERFARAE
ncbi:MAG: SRPBCC domain-containing protein [Labilithrix sp.]|nr:SRPBCC domain-containing protein [Labilithrix sp.]MCW5811810.1 SRPBCC domain-containing protein [Labilithrix sp.]